MEHGSFRRGASGRVAGGACDTLPLMSLLSRLASVPPDPIFAVAAAARAAGPEAIDASIGEIRGEDGGPFFLPSMQEALGRWEREMVPRAGGFPLPPLLGVPAFRACVTRLAAGDDVPVASIAAAGGTGALALQLKLLQRMGIRRVVLPVPTWPAHRRLLGGAGLETVSVPFAADDAGVDAVGDALTRERQPAAALLQVSGHNPTGWTWSSAQWQRLAAALEGSSFVILLDCAYQGLGLGVQEDVAPVGILRRAGVGVFLAWSASKNHTIYGLRTGLACAPVSSDEERALVEGHYAQCTRELWSAAPTPGQQLVALVQQEHRAAWEEELSVARALLQRKRALLTEAFPDWAERLRGAGFFTQLPLSPDAIGRLRAEKVFLADDGRMNLAGVPMARFDALIEKIRAIL